MPPLNPLEFKSKIKFNFNALIQRKFYNNFLFTVSAGVPKTVKIKQILEVVFKGKFNLEIVRNYLKITPEFVPSFLKKELLMSGICVRR